MKLLVDQNISRRVMPAIEVEFPGSVHLTGIRYERAPDAMVWEYAKTNDLTILSRDADFLQFSYRFGPPPKLVWLRTGNQSAEDTAELLRSRIVELRHFAADRDRGVLVLA